MYSLDVGEFDHLESLTIRLHELECDNDGEYGLLLSQHQVQLLA